MYSIKDYAMRGIDDYITRLPDEPTAIGRCDRCRQEVYGGGYWAMPSGDEWLCIGCIDNMTDHEILEFCGCDFSPRVWGYAEVNNQ